MSNVTYKGGKPVQPQKMKKKHMWWRYLLVWFAGFLAVPLIVGVAAAIIGFSMTTKDVINMFGGNANDIFQEKYQNMTLFELINALPNQKYETLGDIDKVTPAIRKTFDEQINPALKESVHFEFNWEEIKNKPFELNANSPRPEEEYDHTQSLVEYIPVAMEQGIKIGNFFIDETTGEIQADGILKYIVYPIIYDESTDTYTVDTESGNLNSLYDIINGGNDFFDNIKNALVIGDVIDTTGSEFLAQIGGWTLAQFTEDNIKTIKIGSLVSGSGAFMEQLADCAIGDLTDEYLKTLEIGLLFDDVPADNLLIKTIKDEHWTINDLSDISNITGLRLDQVIDVSESSDFIKTISTHTFDEIMDAGFVDSLTLKEIFPDATGVLGALADKTYIEAGETKYYTIADLKNNDRVLALTINDIFPDLVSGDLLYAFKDDTLSEISEKDINTVLIKDIFPDYATNKILKAVVDQKGVDVATIGDLTDQTVIDSLPIDAVVDTTGNIVLTALANRGATIGTMSSVVSELTMKEVIDCGDDPTKMIYKIAHSNALNDCPITEIGNNFPQLELSDIFNIDEDSPQVLKALCKKGSTLESLSDDMGDLSVRDVMDIYPGDIYQRDLDNYFEYYLLTNDGWELLEGARLDQELEAYYNPTTGYLALNEAKEFTGTDVPTTTTSSLSSAKPRDSLYSVADTKINNSAEMIEALKNNLTLKDVVDIDDDSPQVLKTLKDTKLVDMADVLKSLTLSQIIDIDSSSSTIIKILAGVTVFGDGTNNLQHALENLNIIDLFGSEAYAKGEKASSRNGIKISFTPKENDLDETTGDIIPTSTAAVLGNSIVTSSGKADNEFIFDKANKSYFYNYLYSTDEYQANLIDTSVKQAYQYVTGSVYSGEEYFDENHPSLITTVNGYEVKIEAIERHKLDMIYWFMFTDPNETFSAENKYYVLKEGYTYSVNNMGSFTTNMVGHVQNESLETLYEAGIITTELEFDAVLRDYIMIGSQVITIPHGGQRLGDLTINQLLDIIVTLLPYISTSI